MTTGLRNLARTLWRFDRSRVARTTVLVIGSALLEGMGVVLLIPLLQLIGIGTEGAPGRASRLIGSSFAAVGLPVTLSAVLAAFVGILLMQAAVQRAQAVESQRLTTSFALYLRETLYSAITRARWDFLAHRRTSDLTQLLTEEADRAAHAAIELIHLGMAAAVSLVYLTVAFRVSPAMSGIALFSGSLLWFLLRRRTQNSRIVGAHFSRSSGMMYRAISEHLSGLKTARSYGAEERHRRAFGSVATVVAEAGNASVASYADVRLIFSAGSALVLAALVYLGSGVLALSAGSILLLLYAFSRLLPRVSTLQQLYQQLIYALPALERIQQAARECEAAADAEGAAREAPHFRRTLEMERVGYLHDDTRGIEDITLTIPARSLLGLTGPSGAGKSTLADLLMGLLTPQQGAVRVDGVPLIPPMMRAWRARIGYVAQECFLFDDSVRENLRCGNPDATDEEIWEALRQSAADDFVARLPGQLDAQVGERGVRLSGGERQRLALARAILRRPSLLILDEATSALDAESEARIRAAVQSLRAEMAVLIISHRAAMLQGLDEIYTLDGGRLLAPTRPSVPPLPTR